MDYEINDLLYENEKIIWKGKPDKTCFVWRNVVSMLPFALLWLIFDGVFIAVIISQWREIPVSVLIGLACFFAIHLIPVWSVIGVYAKNKLEYPNVVYAITDKRIILRHGIIGIDFKSIAYSELGSIDVNVNLFEKIKKSGTINCKVNWKNYQLISVKEPYKVFKMLQKISYDVKTDINYPNAKRPAHNPGYNTNYDYRE